MILGVELILASQSPRRQALIQLVGYPYWSMVAGVDESSVTHPDPAVNVVETAQLKARTIAGRAGNDKTAGNRTLIVAADTTVALDGTMLGKPADPAEARQMLQALRDRTHEVHTGLVVVDLAGKRDVSGVHTAVVTMRDYSEREVEAYVASGDPLDKAGAYAIQHPTFRPVARLDGCYLGVMGLSVCHLLQCLIELDVPVAADLAALEQAHQGYPCPICEDVLAKVG